MIDIVIPVANITKCDHLELRYTLRSIEKHLSGYRNIYIVGYKPEWLQNVIHIDHKDAIKPEYKERNIYHKILAACNDEWVSEEFIMFNDDFFLLQECSAVNYPFYYYGTIEEKRQRISQTNPYRYTLENTVKVLGKDSLNYEVHAPIRFDKQSFMEVIEALDWKDRVFGFGFRAVYCNKLNVPGEYITDIKITDKHSFMELKGMITGRSFFSTGNNAINHDMKDLLAELYPHPSQYESELKY